MRYTWQQIQEIHPDQWVLMKDMEYNYGNLVSAVVICSGKERQDIYRYEEEHPEEVQCIAAYGYTGELIEGIEYNEEDNYVNVELSDVF